MRCNRALERNLRCVWSDLRAYASSRATCIAVCFKFGNAAMKDVIYVTLMPTMYRSDLRWTDNTFAVSISGMEPMGGGSNRLPCNVKSDEMGYWIWICEGLVIVFLTQTCHRVLSSAKGGRGGETTRGGVYAKRKSSRSIRFERYSLLS